MKFRRAQTQGNSPDSRGGIKALKNTAPRLLSLCIPHLKLLIVGTIALALASGVNLLFPYLIRLALNGEYGFVLSDNLGRLTAGLIILFALQSFFFYVRHYAFYTAGLRIVAQVRKQLFGGILGQDIAFFDQARVGDLLSRLSSDTELLQRALTINISVALRYTVQVVGGTIFMLVISAKLTAVILVLIPLLVFCSSIWGRKLKKLSKLMQGELGDASVVAEESISAIRTVHIFAGTKYEEKRYSTAVDKALQTGVARTKVAAVFSSSMVFLMHSAIALIIWYGGSLVLASALSIGDLTGFLLYCVIVAVSFGFLVTTIIEFMQALGASERIFDILDTKAHVVAPTQPKPLPKTGAGSVTFTSVDFHYPSRPEQAVLKNVSFEIPANSTIALVGPSGSGKSTIAALIPRFYDPIGGSVLFRGIPVNELDIPELREQISVVPQQPQIFSFSVGENIAYGRKGASREMVIEAAKAANIHETIERMPEKYDTLVGDKGIQLSGGERQRIAIARAILKDPDFLILDEATSSLDSTNEKLVQEALERLMKDRSSLVIAHRLSTVQHADQVLVLQQGEICQSGTHGELVDSPGLYQTFVQHQLLA